MMMSFESWQQTKFDQGVILSLDVEIKLSRLRERIDEFRDLASIEKWEDIQNDPLITDRLQDAYDILNKAYYMREVILPNGKRKKLRCKPCEMEALCAIKELSV